MARTTVLCVDDDLGFLRSLEKILSHNGFDVSAVASVPEALELISRQFFDVLLADLNIGQPGDGFTVVSAMRRVHPTACTFILTGYPDIETAIEAIRNQVDDYFSKPLNIDELLRAISEVQNGGRPVSKKERPRPVFELIRISASSVTREWLSRVLQEPELSAIPLTDAERIDHLPALLDELVQRLEKHTPELSSGVVDIARRHGRMRYQQGYTIPLIIVETRILQQVLSSAIQKDLLNLELSSLVPDAFAIGEVIQAVLEISVRSFQAQVPRSLQSSFSNLYNSPYLGVAIADETRIIDANDALLEMFGYTREQLLGDGIDWVAMTPESFRPLDLNALRQLREFGTCAPYEKELLLPNGTTLPFLTGAIRLSLDPFQWSAYLIDLTRQRQVHEAEHKIRVTQARQRLINRLAHEINNPLAALMFTIHLMGTHADLSTDARELVRNADEMLARITESVRMVLMETRPADG